MQFYRCDVNHAGSRDMRIHKAEVTPAEIVVLRHLHGVESITGVVKTREGKVQQVVERERLRRIYGALVFAALFPGAVPRMPLTLADCGLNDDGRETQAPESAEDEDEDEDGDAPAAPSDAARAIAARVAARQAKTTDALT